MCLGGPVCRFVWSGSWGVPTSPRGKEGTRSSVSKFVRESVSYPRLIWVYSKPTHQTSPQSAVVFGIGIPIAYWKAVGSAIAKSVHGHAHGVGSRWRVAGVAAARIASLPTGPDSLGSTVGRCV